MLDEPSAGLDPIIAAGLDELILFLQRAFGMTMLVVTHSLESAFRISDRLAMPAIYYVRTMQTVGGQVPYRTYLRYAGGLAPGATVPFGGIKVGEVKAVRPASEAPMRIEIAFEVKTGTPMSEKSTAQVGTVSIMRPLDRYRKQRRPPVERRRGGPVAGNGEPGRNHTPRSRRCRVGERVMGTLGREVPILRAAAPEIPCERQRDQRSAEPETNRASACEPSTIASCVQDRANHRSDRQLAKHADSVVVSVCNWLRTWTRQ